MTTEPPSDKLFTAEETAILRRKFIEKKVIPWVRQRFDKYPRLQSAGLFVGQYYDDEARDAVYDLWVFSVLETPHFDYPFSDETQENLEECLSDPDFTIHSKIDCLEADPINLPNLPNHSEIGWNPDCGWMAWPDNDMAIPLFAAFCKEGAHQDLSSRDSYSPFAIFRKTVDGIDIEYVGEMLRPWLEGIRPQSIEKYTEEEQAEIKQLWLQTIDEI